jgi:hypothetical protein
MTNPVRRFFVAEGPEAEAMADKVLRLNREHSERLTKVKAKYKAHGLQTRDGHPIGLLFHKDHVAPVACKVHTSHILDGQRYIEYRPLLNRKIGREMAEDFKKVGGFNFSEMICREWGVFNMVMGDKGNALWVSVAGVMDKIIVLNLVEDDAQKLEVKPFFREIKRSEFISITEEGGIA